MVPMSFETRNEHRQSTDTCLYLTDKWFLALCKENKQHAEEGNTTAVFNYCTALAITAINLSSAPV